MNLAEPVEWSVMRVGVVLSTRRELVKLSDRLEVATDEPAIKTLFGFRA